MKRQWINKKTPEWANEGKQSIKKWQAKRKKLKQSKKQFELELKNS